MQKAWPSLSGDPQLVQNAAMLISPLESWCFAEEKLLCAQHPDREQRDRQPFRLAMREYARDSVDCCRACFGRLRGGTVRVCRAVPACTTVWARNFTHKFIA